LNKSDISQFWKNHSRLDHKFFQSYPVNQLGSDQFSSYLEDALMTLKIREI